jgi:inhibitor of KinA sporulation pathway (predicted exonuclease)
MGDAIEHMGWNINGRHHSGIDDCQNIGRLMVNLLNEKNLDITTSKDLNFI